MSTSDKCENMHRYLVLINIHSNTDLINMLCTCYSSLPVKQITVIYRTAVGYPGRLLPSYGSPSHIQPGTERYSQHSLYGRALQGGDSQLLLDFRHFTSANHIYLYWVLFNISRFWTPSYFLFLALSLISYNFFNNSWFSRLVATLWFREV